MSFEVYDYRTDVGNMLVTPQIRSRFVRMEPGEAAALHSHDLGHEIFLVLAGRAEFRIDGGTREVGPGQLCVALADEIHSVRTVGDEPMTMYLSVTPHIQPTHTGRTADGERMPTRFAPSQSYDVEPDDKPSMGRWSISIWRRLAPWRKMQRPLCGCRRTRRIALRETPGRMPPSRRGRRCGGPYTRCSDRRTILRTDGTLWRIVSNGCRTLRNRWVGFALIFFGLPIRNTKAGEIRWLPSSWVLWDAAQSRRCSICRIWRG